MSDYDDFEDDYEAFENDYEDYSYRSRDDRRNERIELLEKRWADNERAMIIEKNLREKYPSLQDAWEQYQIVLRTVSNVS